MPAAYAQCPAAVVRFPAENQSAPIYNNMIPTISTVQNAGQYFLAVHIYGSGSVTIATNHTTIMQCMTCLSEPAKVGINEAVPKATLDVNGELLVRNSGRPPVAAMACRVRPVLFLK